MLQNVAEPFPEFERAKSNHSLTKAYLQATSLSTEEKTIAYSFAMFIGARTRTHSGGKTD